MVLVGAVDVVVAVWRAMAVVMTLLMPMPD